MKSTSAINYRKYGINEFTYLISITVITNLFMYVIVPFGVFAPWVYELLLTAQYKILNLNLRNFRLSKHTHPSHQSIKAVGVSLDYGVSLPGAAERGG